MTAARHARPPARPLTAVAVAVAAVAGVIPAWASPGNTPPPRPAIERGVLNTPWFTERWTVRRQP